MLESYIPLTAALTRSFNNSDNPSNEPFTDEGKNNSKLTAGSVRSFSVNFLLLSNQRIIMNISELVSFCLWVCWCHICCVGFHFLNHHTWWWKLSPAWDLKIKVRSCGSTCLYKEMWCMLTAVHCVTLLLSEQFRKHFARFFFYKYNIYWLLY